MPAWLVGATVAVSAQAKGGTGNITKVEFYQGITKIGEKTSDPYTITFSPTTAGATTLSAKVTDDDGGSASSIAIPLTVTP